LSAVTVWLSEGRSY